MTEANKTIIRQRREKECFPIVNRSILWYRRLTQCQRDELSKWYQDWLDAPETERIPNKLAWVDNKTKPEEILL